MAYDEALAERIRGVLDSDRGVTERRMFGGLAFLVNGNMAVAASGQGGLLLRVDPQRGNELLKQPHVRPMVMRGRAMDGWLRIDDESLRTKSQLQRWVKQGVEYARSLPPKR
jgi:TfoX/Sxy family transcriptional regulator of competence genes